MNADIPFRQPSAITGLMQCSKERQSKSVRGRDASYLAPPAQIRTGGFPAYGSHLGCMTARRSLSLATFRMRSSACVTLCRRCVRCVLCWCAFPLVPTLRSTGSSTGRPASFVGFLATMMGSDFSGPCIIGYGFSPSRCGPSLSRDTDGRTRDLPASDAIPLHVMWPSTPAGRQHLA